MSGAPTLEWKAVPSHVAEGPAEVRHKDGWLVCEVSADSYAYLIAAAPEMAEALRFIAAQENLTFAECLIAEKIVGVARDALAKAGVK